MMTRDELITKRELLQRNIRAGEGVTFANGPFAEYEQERVARRIDLRNRLSDIEQEIRKIERTRQ